MEKLRNVNKNLLEETKQQQEWRRYFYPKSQNIYGLYMEINFRSELKALQQH